MYDGLYKLKITHYLIQNCYLFATTGVKGLNRSSIIRIPTRMMSQQDSRENIGQYSPTNNNQHQGIIMPSPPLLTTTNNSTTVDNTSVHTTSDTHVSVTGMGDHNSNNKDRNAPGDNSVVVLDNSEGSDDDELAIIGTRERPTRHSIVDLDNEPEIISVRNTNNTTTNNVEGDDDLAIIEERHVRNPPSQANSNLNTIPLHLPGGNSIQINLTDYERPYVSSFVNNESYRDTTRRTTPSSRLRRQRRHNNRSNAPSISGSAFPVPPGSNAFISRDPHTIPLEMQDFIINSFTQSMSRRRRQRYQAHLNRVRQRRLLRRINYEREQDGDYRPPVESDSSNDSEFGPWDDIEEMLVEEEGDLYDSQSIVPPPLYDEDRRTQNIISFIEQRENRERDIKIQKLKEKSEPLKQKYIDSAEEIERKGNYTSKFNTFTDENEQKDTSVVPACTLCGVELGVGIPKDYEGISEEDKSTPFSEVVRKYRFHCPYQSLFRPTQLDKDLSKRTFISKGCGHLFCGRCFARIDNAKGKAKLSKKKLAELKGSSNPNNYGPRICPASDCKAIIRARSRLKEVYF